MTEDGRTLRWIPNAPDAWEGIVVDDSVRPDVPELIDAHIGLSTARAVYPGIVDGRDIAELLFAIATFDERMRRAISEERMTEAWIYQDAWYEASASFGELVERTGRA